MHCAVKLMQKTLKARINVIQLRQNTAKKGTLACFTNACKCFSVIENAAKNLSSMFCMFLLCRFCFALRSALAVTGARTLASEQNKTCV